jgi:hypothetical protein
LLGFLRGQRYFQHNFFTMFAAKLCGLLALLAVPSIVRVLSLTKQSGTPSTAFKRYLSTLDHMLSWYEGDLLEPTSKYVKRSFAFSMASTTVK